VSQRQAHNRITTLATASVKDKKRDPLGSKRVEGPVTAGQYCRDSDMALDRSMTTSK
jgi:hypothetical protein